jgi:hypothetical protein
MPVLDTVVSRLSRFPELAQTLTLTQLEKFLRLASRLLPAIQSDEVNKGSTHTEITLPVTITDFLAASLQLPQSTVTLCWAGFGDLVGETTDLLSDDEALGSIGPTFGIGGCTVLILFCHLSQTCVWQGILSNLRKDVAQMYAGISPSPSVKNIPPPCLLCTVAYFPLQLYPCTVNVSSVSPW